ncbi:MAG: hypothetical protein ACREI7_02225, partial [Myxococcota bacterium]
HCTDHRPEQYRLASVRGSLRLVSTPACRAARAACAAHYDAVDHVMTYFFADVAGLEPFYDLAVALRGAGRMRELLPMVARGVYGLDGMTAAPRIKIGADVLPWWPPRGVYVLLERGSVSPAELTTAPGVAGIWSATGIAKGMPYSNGADNTGMQITYCYLDEEPAAAGVRLRPLLEKRWADGGAAPLLAAPFHTIVPYEWDRYVP